MRVAPVWLVPLFILWTGCRQSNAQDVLAYGSCDDEIDGEIVYYACVAEALHLLEGANSNFQVVVEPEDATCGTPSDNIFAYNPNCTHGSLGPVQDCTVCDQEREQHSHPPELMTDNMADTYWLSRTWLDYADQPQDDPLLPVNITLSFNHAYVLQDEISIEFWSSRPKRMVMYRSTDGGVTWSPWQYYDMQCGGSPGEGVVITEENPDAVICTETYSRELPYSDGEVLFPVTEERFQLYLGSGFSDFPRLYEALNNTQLDEFLTFTDIMISLLYPMTDGQESLRQPLDLIKYYYGISDISVTASCDCNLHGRFCTIEEGVTSCDCRHNTMGSSCELCLPLYNNRTWQPGQYLPYPTGTANECQLCECNNHTESCTYNSTLEHGVCDNCTHQTTGSFCEQCVQGYYINQSLPLTHPDICTECECEPLGMEDVNATCDPESGQCPCKLLIQPGNRRCDTCASGYYGLLLLDNQPGVCKECACAQFGTLFGASTCEQTSGQCPCKDTVTGRACDQCRDGYHDFPSSIATECRACNCNPGGAVNASCDEDGQCYCRPGLSGLKCDTVAGGMFAPHIDSLSLQPGIASTCALDTDVSSEDNPFTGALYAVCGEEELVEYEPLLGGFTQPTVVWPYIPVIRYSRNATQPDWSTMTLVIRASGDSGQDLAQYPDGISLDPSCPFNQDVIIVLTNWTSGVGEAIRSHDVVDLDSRCNYEVALQDNASVSDAGEILIDSIVFLPDPREADVYLIADELTREEYNDCIDQILPLATREDALATEQCHDFFFSLMVQQANGAQACACNETGSVGEGCSDLGGECTCKPGAGGQSCDQCLPGYFNFTDTGCTPCECAVLGSVSPLCDAVTGQCGCLDNVAARGQIDDTGAEAGRTCAACRQDHYGYISGLGCSDCQCSDAGSLASQCDGDSGQCVCKDTIGSLQCDACLPGYYLFTSQGCTTCNCSEAGSASITCHQDTGDCTCKAHVQGAKCDTCQDDTFNLYADNPDGCQPCFCYGHGTQCTSADGYQLLNINASREEIATDWTLSSPALESSTHLQAPASFLGENGQLYAYAHHVTVSFRARVAEVNMTGHMPLIIEGRGEKLYYHPADDMIVPAGQEVTFEMLLHESLWRNLSSENPVNTFNFYAILAALESVYVQRSFGGPLADVLYVQWLSAEQSPEGASTVTGVENCTCEPSRNVQGISCASCDTGHQRMALPGDVYDVCVSCDCNGRGETDPPMCDESTGECLNCRNGTVGFSCEECAPNVLAPSCTACQDTFWGIDRDGCQPCLCDEVGALDAVCDRDSGQCACADFVEGQHCDVCEDNYFHLRDDGCSECDVCYALVGEQVDILRDLRTNLTDVLTELQAGDSTQTLGSFTERLLQTTASMQQLTQFLETAQEVQVPVTETVAILNNSLNALRESLSNAALSLLDAANQSTVEAGSIVEHANEQLSVINITVREADGLIADVIEPITVQLEELVVAMQDLETEISGASNGSLGQALELGQVVLEIEEGSSDANALNTQSLQTVQQNLGTHVTTTGQITELSNYYSLVNTQVSDRLTQSDTVTNVTSDIMAAVAQAQTTIEELQLPDEEGLDQLQAQNDNLEARAYATIEEVAREISTIDETVNVTAVAIETASMVTRADSTRAVVDDFLARMTGAQTAVTEAAALIDDTLTDAQTMLNITSDFDARALAVETQANTSLESVETLISNSEAAIATAQNISTELYGCLSESDNARLTAQNASDVAAANQLSVTSMPSRVDTLQSRYTDGLTDLVFKANSIVNSNLTLLAPAHDTCVDHKNRVNETEHMSQASRDTMTSLQHQMNSTGEQLDTIISVTQALPSIDTSDLAALGEDVDETRRDFDARELDVEVRELAAAIAEKREWLEVMRARKTQLQQQLARLRDIHAQLET